MPSRRTKGLRKAARKGRRKGSRKADLAQAPDALDLHGHTLPGEKSGRSRPPIAAGDQLAHSDALNGNTAFYKAGKNTISQNVPDRIQMELTRRWHERQARRERAIARVHAIANERLIAWTRAVDRARAIERARAVERARAIEKAHVIKYARLIANANARLDAITNARALASLRITKSWIKPPRTKLPPCTGEDAAEAARQRRPQFGYQILQPAWRAERRSYSAVSLPLEDTGLDELYNIADERWRIRVPGSVSELHQWCRPDGQGATKSSRRSI